MNFISGDIKKNKAICIVIFFFLLIKIATIFIYKTAWWDASVYIGMGKYIYSLGSSGLWESSRPIVWPIILGFFWKIGLNVVFFGKLIEIIFGALCILLTYLIGKKLFSKKIALLASIFLALSPTFFFFNGILLTEIVSTFLSLAAIYFFMDKKYFASGIFFGAAFMTRYLQIFAFIAMVFSFLFSISKKDIKNLKKIIMGFVIAISPFLILNQILYNNALFPFLYQAYLSNNSGWLNYHPIGYYFIQLFRENIFYFLSFFGIFPILKAKDINKKFIAVAFLLFFIFFNSIKQKEMRFLIVLMPYMYLLISFSLVYFLNIFKNKHFKNIIVMAISISFLIPLHTAYAYYKNESNKNNPYEAMQNEMENIKSQDIWISSPIMAVLSNNKISELIYYPFFNEEKKQELIKDYDKADFIFLDSCDLACKPLDFKCNTSRNELIAFLKKKSNVIFSRKTGNCEQFIFRK